MRLKLVDYPDCETEKAGGLAANIDFCRHWLPYLKFFMIKTPYLYRIYTAVDKPGYRVIIIFPGKQMLWRGTSNEDPQHTFSCKKNIDTFLCSPKNFGGAYSRRFVRASVRPSRSCPRKFSETACRISMKLHGNIKYQRWMRISPACSGSMIFPRVTALWWVLHEYIGYCSCPREFSETTSRISLKLHGNIKYGRWMCISPACSGSMILPRVIALWWVLHEYIGYCSCPRKFLANTGRNSTKF